MKQFILITVHLLFTSTLAFSQLDSLVEREIKEAQEHLEKIRKQETELKSRIEKLKFDMCKNAMQTIGTPTGHEAELQTVQHAAFISAYDEKHEQSRWVMHIILPEIIEGNFGRSNNFREDTLVKTGTAGKDDYWESGFDRGHLAPSADFRWSAQALSESYFYSNISPQKPELNRERWAEMEDLLRAYVVSQQKKLFVVSGPVFKNNTEQIGKKNKVTVPDLFYKVAMDPASGKSIAFLMPNGNCSSSLLHYAVPIDSVEKITGLNFFPNLNLSEEKILESKLDVTVWKDAREEGNSEPLSPEDLPKGKFNTAQAKYHIGEKITVCGKVVSTKYAEKSGATFINLDRKFPDQIFTIQIWKDARTNFSYAPEVDLQGKTVCVTGKITENQGVATVTISNENAIVIEDE